MLYQSLRLSCLILGLFSSISLSHSANPLYFLCGPDEDGCFDEIAQYCSCTPYNTKEAKKPYCFDFNKLTCTPLAQVSDCPADFVYKDQGSCLAVIFQSEPSPPCRLTTKSYCLRHNTSICAENGLPESCIPFQSKKPG